MGYWCLLVITRYVFELRYSIQMLTVLSGGVAPGAGGGINFAGGRGGTKFQNRRET